MLRESSTLSLVDEYSFSRYPVSLKMRVSNPGPAGAELVISLGGLAWTL